MQILNTEAFESALRGNGFRGDVFGDDASRIVNATDNSVYQVTPDLIVAPCDHDDVQTLMEVLQEPAWRHIPVTPRGGLTGTNGQSLNGGIIVDLSRHMKKIIAFDLAEGWVEVETGIVRDELNKALAAQGMFFAATTSTSPVPI